MTTQNSRDGKMDWEAYVLDLCKTYEEGIGPFPTDWNKHTGSAKAAAKALFMAAILGHKLGYCNLVRSMDKSHGLYGLLGITVKNVQAFSEELYPLPQASSSSTELRSFDTRVGTQGFLAKMQDGEFVFRHSPLRRIKYRAQMKKARAKTAKCSCVP